LSFLLFSVESYFTHFLTGRQLIFDQEESKKENISFVISDI